MLLSRAIRQSGTVLLFIAVWPALLAAQPSSHTLQVGPVVMTVADMGRSVEFYKRVLTFEKESETERSGQQIEALYGVPNAHMRTVELKLGDEAIELLQFIGMSGKPVPADARSSDLSFQHVAIIVSDMDRAYVVLRQNNVQYISPYPQRLPDWNPNAAGIKRVQAISVQLCFPILSLNEEVVVFTSNLNMSMFCLHQWVLRRETTIKSQRLACIVRGALGEEPRYCICDLFGSPDPTWGTNGSHSLNSLLGAKDVEQQISVRTVPGLTAFTRIQYFSLFDGEASMSTSLPVPRPISRRRNL